MDTKLKNLFSANTWGGQSFDRTLAANKNAKQASSMFSNKDDATLLSPTEYWTNLMFEARRLPSSQYSHRVLFSEINLPKSVGGGTYNSSRYKSFDNPDYNALDLKEMQDVW